VNTDSRCRFTRPDDRHGGIKGQRLRRAGLQGLFGIQVGPDRLPADLAGEMNAGLTVASERIEGSRVIAREGRDGRYLYCILDASRFAGDLLGFDPVWKPWSDGEIRETGGIDVNVQGDPRTWMACALEDRPGSVRLGFEKGRIDLPQLAVEAMAHLIDGIPIRTRPCLLNQPCRSGERLADPPAVREGRYRSIDAFLGLPQGGCGGIGQALCGRKVRKAGRQVITNIAFRLDRTSGSQLQVKAPSIDRIVAPSTHALGCMCRP
jgi:hypothetical protein